MLGNMFDDVDRVNVVLQELLGKGHCATSFAIARGVAMHPKR
jgi:hypothetical protein